MTTQSQATADMVRSYAEADQPSVIALIQDLVKIPSRGGLDPYSTIIDHVTQWLSAHGLPCRQLTDRTTDRVVALVCDVPGTHPGPRHVLDACLDTAPFGDLASWRHPPTSGTVEDGWLYGRGAADSKAAIAIFSHVAKHAQQHADKLHGTLTLLFDADEHTGQFGGAKRYFNDQDTPSDIHGVMIGYPGLDELVIGGRGFLRAQLTVRGEAGHTGSQRAANNINAVEKAAELVQLLARTRQPDSTDTTLGLPPKLTVTKIRGGESYSIIPDHCTIDVDVRLTTTFDETAARNLLSTVVNEVDNRPESAGKPTTISYLESWPAYRLDDDASIRRALTSATQHHLRDQVTPRVAGPSNIGNYLARLGINATAGFGVIYEGLHGTDERIDVSTIPLVQAVYHEAILTLLSG